MELLNKPLLLLLLIIIIIIIIILNFDSHEVESV